jgi:poly(3-hydroxybutyrate) depolymerase
MRHALGGLVIGVVPSTFVLVALLAAGCSSGTGSPSPGTGGTSGTGGSGTGGAVGTGGSSATGGSTVTGGTTGSGGVVGSGGSPGTGGRTGTGGAPASGGTTGSGGGTSAGGRSGSGGATASGGAPGSGGTTASGGATSAGGKTGTGGTSALGGTAGTTIRPDGAAGTGGAGTDGSAGGGSGTSAGCGKAPTIASSQYNNGTRIPITAANMQRRYILNVPKNYDNTKPYRLIIAFHQLDGNDVQMYNNGYYHLLNLDTAGSTIFVAPNGQKNGAPCSGTGSGESGCGWPNGSNADFALADAVVAQVEENFCIDTNKIFANGWSYGGAMSYETGCGRPLGGTNGYLRAIAVYSGSSAITSGPCPPTKPVGYYASHGTNDTVLQYSGGVSMAQNYAKANGCTWATPTQATSSSAHVCTKLSGCTAGYPVEFCSFVGGHTPDPSDGGGGSWEYQNVWTFFSQF